MKKQYSKPMISFEEMLKQDVLMTSETTSQTAEGQIINDGPAETIDFG